MAAPTSKPRRISTTIRPKTMAMRIRSHHAPSAPMPPRAVAARATSARAAQTDGPVARHARFNGSLSASTLHSDGTKKKRNRAEGSP